MLAIENRTPYAAERTPVMDKRGAKSWVVVVKATYDVRPDGTTPLAEQQKPPLFTPEYYALPGQSSIRYEADLVPTKPATDVLLNGCAYAPAGRPVNAADVGMRVGELTKKLRVYGDRRWERGLLGRMAMTEPASFTRMPLRYERAFGGWDRTDKDPAKQRLFPANPIGTGFALRAAQLDGQLLPNIERPEHPIANWEDRPHPSGFGTIASYWSPRLQRAGTYNEVWRHDKFPLLPDDFDDRFYQCAPEDQQVSKYLRGGEPVELVNLSEARLIRFSLPKVFLAFTTWFGRQSQEHRATLQTVIFEPDDSQVVLVWQTSLACHCLIDQLDVTVITEKRYL